MKYRLPKSVSLQPIDGILTKEFKKQKVAVPPLPKKRWKETALIFRAIQEKGIPDFLVCKKLSDDLGYGIFLHPKAKPLQKGHIIAPYAGEIILSAQNDEDDSAYAFDIVSDFHLSKEDQLRLHPNKRYHPSRLYCVKLDACKKGNFTRFINHSERPNVIAEMFSIPKNNLGMEPSVVEIFYMVKRTIRPGEQLLVDYEDGDDSYWGPQKIDPFPMFPATFLLDSSLQVKRAL